MILPIVTFSIVLLLAISVVRGAPYVPTHKQSIEIALDLLDLKPGQHMVDVGSGDGSVLMAAARRGIRATGYEINPVLCIVARIRARKYGDLIDIRWADMWNTDVPEDTSGVFVFTMGRYMERLAQKLRDQGLDGVRLVSHAFELPGVKPIKKVEALLLYEIRT